MIRRRKLFWNVTNKLILANILVFVLALVLIKLNPKTFDFIALKPSAILQGKYLWTVITSMFMHSPVFLLHIFANMVSLFFLGTFLERLIGPRRFLFVYFTAGILGALFFVFWAGITGQNLDVPAVGASAAIFGLGGVLAVITPRLPVYIMFIPIPIPMYIAIFLLFAILALLPFIANSAHLGGLVAGLLYGLYLRKKYARKVRILQRYFR